LFFTSTVKVSIGLGGASLGIFSDNVRKYFEHGLITIPCKDKRPVLGKEWQRFCEEGPSEATIEKWETQYQDINQLGLVLGASTLMSGFDFDYEFNERKSSLSKSEFDKDRKAIEKQLLAILPPTPAIKTGKKGWTRIYRSHGNLENAQCDRNGLRLFDFLARNKQTIIPPSIYSDDSDMKYRWIGQPIESCLDDIPFITQDIVNEAKMLLADAQGYDFAANGRHGLLLKWLLDVVRIEQDEKKIIHMLIQRDIKTNPHQPYLSDPKHFAKHREPQANALEWIKRVRKFANATTKTQIPIGSDGWDYFFENTFHQTRKDIISKQCFFKIDKETDWDLMANVEGALRSYANRKSLPVAGTRDELERWTLEKKDLEFLCDLPQWDGQDRAEQFGKSIKSPNFTGEEISDILKHWGSNIFRRVKSPENQNRCVILKGGQGLGKDYLVRSMLKDFKPYYESTTMPGTQKDALEIVSRLLAVHIEEFDQTKHIDVAFLKSLITQPSAFFRESYGSNPNKKITRPSFISTANVDDILRDPTGNRRFIVIPVDGIEWSYPQDQSLALMAQFKAHSDRGEYERLSEVLEEKIRVIIDSFTPEDLSVGIVDLYSAKMSALMGHNGRYAHLRYLSAQDAIETLMEISRQASCSLRKVQSSVKSQGLSHRFRDGIRYFASKEVAAEFVAKSPKNHDAF
jgi:hypothetical protein